MILSADLARLYAVEPRVLNQAVKRNAERFPSDFAFRLRKEELGELRPLAFTEHGAVRAATVLNSWRAIGG